MTLKESLLYSGLSASLSILAWGLRFAWVRLNVLTPGQYTAAKVEDWFIQSCFENIKSL